MREPINIKPDIMESIYSFEESIQLKDAKNHTVEVRVRPYVLS